jgi:hypothetical protein
MHQLCCGDMFCGVVCRQLGSILLTNTTTGFQPLLLQLLLTLHPLFEQVVTNNQ